MTNRNRVKSHKGDSARKMPAPNAAAAIDLSGHDE